jgi:ABC-type lipoprotein export system ATPase subunit
MLTRLRIRNFKRFRDVEIELGKTVVLIGPNNSGKTTALQALALWEVGMRRWLEKRSGRPSPEKRPGVTINRRDLLAIPVPSANLLWRSLHVRNVERVEFSAGQKKQKTQNVRIDVLVDGITNGQQWTCGLEFDYANDESIYCRPLRAESGAGRVDVPKEADGVRMAFLPPMSGLAAVEPKWEPGRINVLLGEGQTAQVLRNLCHQLESRMDDRSAWESICEDIDRLFGVKLLAPRYLAERGEVAMEYVEPDGSRLDLACAGRGLQQTLLLLAHLRANPGSVLLLDEPDAHLEILRQRQTYQLLKDTAQATGSQVIAASHSEVILNEAAGQDTVVAFVGRPHRLGGRTSQVVKALASIGFDQYYLAEHAGWVLYVEDASDLAALRSLARKISHPALPLLEQPFVRYVATNLPNPAREHFYGLREAKPDLVGIAIFDRLDKELQSGQPLVETMWQRREIENYFCTRETLLAYARHDTGDDLFGHAECERRVAAMESAISRVSSALATLGKPDPWSPDLKVSDELLEPVLRNYFEALGLPVLLRKSGYHQLAEFMATEDISAEVGEKLEAIVRVASSACRPAAS